MESYLTINDEVYHLSECTALAKSKKARKKINTPLGRKLCRFCANKEGQHLKKDKKAEAKNAIKVEIDEIVDQMARLTLKIGILREKMKDLDEN